MKRPNLSRSLRAAAAPQLIAVIAVIAAGLGLIAYEWCAAHPAKRETFAAFSKPAKEPSFGNHHHHHHKQDEEAADAPPAKASGKKSGGKKAAKAAVNSDAKPNAD